VCLAGCAIERIRLVWTDPLTTAHTSAWQEAVKYDRWRKYIMKEILTVIAALLVLAARVGIPIIFLFAMGYASERLRRSQENGGMDTGKFWWLVV